MSKIEKPKSKQQFYKRKLGYKKPSLDINQRGFLCSCNNREKDCIRESYNLLNKYADILYPSPVIGKESNVQENIKEASIEDELKNELNELRNEKNESKRFQVIESGAKNFLFIKTTLKDPVQLAEKIVSEIAEKQSQETKFLLRLIPIEVTCKAFLKDIEKSFDALAEKYFTEATKKFSIIFNHRNSNSVSRDEVIKAVADIVFSKRSDHKVDLKEAEVSIVIEVIRGIALLAVVPNFLKYKKYNLLAICGTSNEAQIVKEEKTADDQNIEESVSTSS